MSRGLTFPEVVAALLVVGVVLAAGMPRLVLWRDGLAVRRAAREAASFYHRARLAAVFHGFRVRVVFREDSLLAAFEALEDSTFLALPGPARHGVALTASRPVIRLAPTGLGWGAANTRVVLRRGATAESLTTSRLGRLRSRP